MSSQWLRPTTLLIVLMYSLLNNVTQRASCFAQTNVAVQPSTWQPLHKLIAPLPTYQQVGDIETTPVGNIDTYEFESSTPSGLGNQQEAFAGYACQSDHECANGLQCVQAPTSTPMMMTTSTSTNTTNNKEISRRSLFSSVVKHNHQQQTRVCSLRECKSSCTNLTIQCPADSYIEEWEEDSCCVQTCKCLPDLCQRHNCTQGYDIVRNGNQNQPGNCCTTIQCLDETVQNETLRPSSKSLPCTDDNGHNYEHGQQWRTTKCHLCQCKNGVAVCNKTQTCPLLYGCSSDDILVLPQPQQQEETFKLLPDQCCPKCDGCLYHGRYYNHSENWTSPESDCQTCICTNSRVKCHTFACQPISNCPKNFIIKRNHECCEQCTCEFNCPAGYRRDAAGQEQCECLPESSAGPHTGWYDNEHSSTTTAFNSTTVPNSTAWFNTPMFYICAPIILCILIISIFCYIFRHHFPRSCFDKRSNSNTQRPTETQYSPVATYKKKSPTSSPGKKEGISAARQLSDYREPLFTKSTISEKDDNV